MNSQAFDREAEDAHRLAPDEDPQETREWMQALSAVITTAGPGRAHYLLEQLLEHARQHSIDRPFSANTAYVNTLEPEQEAHCASCNMEIEMRLRAYARWNAMMMVVRANRLNPPDGGDLGGHIGSYASVASMFSAGFNHFWHAETPEHGGDCLYIQGHSAPGIYARAFLEGRLSEEQLDHFRQETGGKGLSSYPHPMLMPHFWQFPTVSMGLGPLMAIYQARFLKYLHARGIADTANRKVWAFCGDGEMDEPESLGAIGLAARDMLDNLIFVVNCNLQRLDGPVRGNGKIIQELEGEFRGAGWNVVKVIWGPGWDALLAQDKEGILQRVMMETVDGEYQNYKAKDGAYVRKHFFGKHPKLLEMVANMTDDDIWRLTRGGHDPHKIYAAFKIAQEHKGQPTVLLVKTIKGYGMGKSGEARNTAHQTKKLDDEAIREMRDRFNIPIPDDKLAEIPFFKPADDSPEMKYLHERRAALGGFVPQRRTQSFSIPTPPLDTLKAILDGTRYTPGKWDDIGLHCSMTERRADEADRDVENWLKCYYMQDRIGEEFDGSVSSVVPFGLFVALDDVFVEGLVHISDLGSDYFHYDDAHHSLVGERTGERYRLSDRVRVQLVRVNMEASKIDFRLIAGPARVTERVGKTAREKLAPESLPPASDAPAKPRRRAAKAEAVEVAQPVDKPKKAKAAAKPRAPADSKADAKPAKTKKPGKTSLAGAKKKAKTSV